MTAKHAKPQKKRETEAYKIDVSRFDINEHLTAAKMRQYNIFVIAQTLSVESNSENRAREIYLGQLAQSVTRDQQIHK